MRIKTLLIAFLGFAIAVAFFIWRGDSQHVPKEGEDAHHEAQENHVEVTPDIAAESGITLETAGPGTVRETVQLTGRILLNQNTSAYVKARFPGVVREVRKSVGETVTKGDVLARVESNDSLQVYSVTAPLGGIVLERNINQGDTAGDTPIFIISDLSQLWAEFHVFPQDSRRIQPGQKITVSGIQDNLTGEAEIISVLPMAESSTQTLVVRALLANSSNEWRPSMIVHGDATTQEKPVELAVRTEAIQRIGEEPTLFVQQGDGFEARKLRTGLSDAEWTEVLEGLTPGETYAAKNSFLLKAELGKSEAGHSH